MSSLKRGTCVLVSHPHAVANANGIAAGLSSAGLLSLYATGVAAAPGTVSSRVLDAAGQRRPEALNRILQGIPASRLRSLAAVELGTRLVGKVGAYLGRPAWPYDAMFIGHDLAVSTMPWPPDLTAVYAYEDAALRTFRRAAARGLVRIWDLPLPHYRTIRKLWHDEATRFPDAVVSVPSLPEWKIRRKDTELAAADFISVASTFTRRSLEDADVHQPVCVVPYGFPTLDFVPKPSVHEGPFTVVAVGTHDLRKGTPYLLEAWKQAAIRGARLVLVGPMRLARGFLQRYANLFEHIPYVPKSTLGAVYGNADILAFPTLGDGFGLVMQEAMCSGTPVVTTPCGGGPEVIRHGENGWIIPERNIDALVDALREAARDRERTCRMGREARRTAESWSWDIAGRRFASQWDRVLRNEAVSFCVTPELARRCAE